ncbi:three-Cys-motif partner protein TcmP [Streptomyces luteireticuli]|uniref:three-Cys-motif partner protein TcmP n=1 Tax=Streptomyces luteireticuli TaxID=173858 RepID=UPI003557B4B5
MAVPKETIWQLDPHTAAKHDLLKKYLQPWSLILLSQHDTVTYAEGFAGPGIYTKGEPGSPIVAHAVFADTLRQRPKNIRMVLVEEDGRRVAELHRQVGRARQRTGSQRLTTAIHQGTCHPLLIHELRTEGRLGRPLFVLLDSYGGPDIPFELLKELARYPSTEVLITFVPSFLTRFAEKNDMHRSAGNVAFGSTDWQAVFTRRPDEKFTFLRDQYRITLRRAGFSHALYFEMVDEGGHPLYLLFGTSHARGLEKMKDAMWSVDSDHGVRYRDPKDLQQQQLELEMEPDTGPLRRILRDHIASSPNGRTVAELKKYTLLETVYRPAQVTALVRQMRNDRLVATEPYKVTSETIVLPYVPDTDPKPRYDQGAFF